MTGWRKKIFFFHFFIFLFFIFYFLPHLPEEVGFCDRGAGVDLGQGSEVRCLHRDGKGVYGVQYIVHSTSMAGAGTVRLL